MNSTPLSTVLNRMDAWQSLATIEEQFKVRFLDTALRMRKRNVKFPFWIRQSTLKVFDDVLIYPVNSDHNDLVRLDKDSELFADQERFKFTSQKQFYEDPDGRSDLADIFDRGTRYLGVRANNLNVASQTLDTAEDVSVYSVSDDATAVAKDTVVVKKGNASMKITVVNSAGTATIKNTFTSFSDSNYKQKFHFKWVYLASVPTSITLRFQTDDSNYLSTVATTQFSGQAFQAGAWNLIAQNLDEATETGTFDSTAIASEKIILTGASTGIYYIDESNLRQWVLMDYQYYSTFTVALVGSTVPDQEALYNSSEVYSTDSEIVGDDEWIDLVMFDAMVLALGDKENQEVLREIKPLADEAEEELAGRYPEMSPNIIENYYRFNNNPNHNNLFHRHD